MTNLHVTITDWSAEEGGNSYIYVYRMLKYFADNLYNDFEPTRHNSPEYIFRLCDWIDNVTEDEEKKLLFKLASKIFYINQGGIEALNRTAYSTVVKKWIFEVSGISCDDHELQSKMLEEMKTVWYTSVSDSMRINSFYKINNLESSHQFRPEWRTFKAMSNPVEGTAENNLKNWYEYVNRMGVKYIVVLEDFVGSGRQCSSIIKFVAESFPNKIVLFVPLIVCSKGLEKLENIAQNLTNLSIKPIIVLPGEAFLSWKKEDEYLLSESPYEKLQTDKYAQVINDLSEDEIKKLNEFNLGALIVMYTNTPNNTSPLIHVNTASWKGLFPRINRS